MEPKSTDTPLPPDTLALLACPQCKNDLIYDPRDSNLTCPVCCRLYRIRDGIPDMLPEDAEET